MEKYLKLMNSIVDENLKMCVVNLTEEDFDCQMLPVSYVGTTYEINICKLWDDAKQDIKTRQRNKSIEPELFALLHEIGHCKTYSKKIDRQYKKWATAFNKCKNLEKGKKIHNNLKWEKMADGWANNYIDKNLQKVNNWNLQLKEILQEME